MQSERAPRFDRLLIVATLLWIAGLPTYWLVANLAMVGFPALKADRLAYLVVAGLLALRLAARRGGLPLSGVNLAVAIYLGVALVSWLSTVPGKDMVTLKQDADFLLKCFFMPFTAFFVARSVEWTPRRATTCLWVLVAGVGTCLVVIGLAQATFDWGFLVPAAFTEHPDRTKGTFENAVPYAVVMAMLLILALFLYLRQTRGWARWALVALAVALVQCVVTSKTRVVWIALPVALALVGFRMPALRRINVFLVSNLAAQIFLAPALGVDPWELQSRVTETEPMYHRAGVAATATNMIRHRPLFGFGLGARTFRRENSAYHDSWFGLSKQWAEYPGHPHNEFLNVMVLMGIVGLAAYLVLLGASWWALVRAFARQGGMSSGAQLVVIAQAAFLILVITGQSHDVMYMSYPQVLVFFLLGIALTPATSGLGGQA